MTSFTITVTNNTGYDLLSPSIYVPFPDFSMSNFGTILNGATSVSTVTLNNPKDNFLAYVVFPLTSHPYPYNLSINNENLLLASNILASALGGYNGLSNSFTSSVTLGSGIGFFAGDISITLNPITLVTII